MKKLIYSSLFLMNIFIVSCSSDDNNNSPISKDINIAEKVSVDRFSASAGNLFIRNATNGLPAANTAINMDMSPFITTGFDRTGAVIRYYNFDVQSTTPDNIYVFFKSGSATPVIGQNNVIPSLPGESDYNDFWLVTKVIVPNNYVSNSITSEAEILTSGFTIEETNIIVNCPVVPFGSTASRSSVAGSSSSLTLGWYEGKAVAYFEFNESSVNTTASGLVPTSPIYVMFNDNATGPASGFVVEPNTSQTHNVLGTIPGDASYSPLWSVLVLDNANFSSVSNLSSASSFPNNVAGANVNCPTVK